ncbi:hypothetical protein ACF07S_23615 [Streptomyces sp. NPDC016640]|uniref:hypothetical protein n=1 Tax=Streptomyces sp. NPDC016640 TaxID=3364969 RepID=UPI0036F99BD0
MTTWESPAPAPARSVRQVPAPCSSDSAVLPGLGRAFPAPPGAMRRVAARSGPHRDRAPGAHVPLTAP